MLEASRAQALEQATGKAAIAAAVALNHRLQIAGPLDAGDRL